MASDVTLLPQPDSPTMPSVRPRLTLKLDAVDRMRRGGRHGRGSGP